jgi:hypothetical protein
MWAGIAARRRALAAALDLALADAAANARDRRQ